MKWIVSLNKLTHSTQKKIHGRNVRERNNLNGYDTVVFKGERFIGKPMLDIKTQEHPTTVSQETFQYDTNFSSRATLRG